MGLSLSCPLGDLDDHLESPLAAEDLKTAKRSISFNGRDLKSCASKRVLFEGSLSFKGREMESMFSFTDVSMPLKSFTKRDTDNKPRKSKDSSKKKVFPSEFPELGNKQYQAAVKLQKVYKSFRTRRQLADCAVLVEQRWWKLLDFAELKRSSISFFDIEKPETAVSRWSRARTRAAKVGKGLSKDEKARQLALQHWLEAIDPRHRYGHNLQFYYVTWLHCNSKQPFFYWLDIGEGKDVNLERCPRTKLQQQCIKYLGPTEREEYEVVVENGKLAYKQSGKVLDTTGSSKDAKWIFVLSTSKTLYVGQKKKGTFQHSSFLAGGATLSAGRLVVEDGVLKAVWPHSGHYLPTEENFEEFMSFLKEHDVDLTNVQKSPTEEDEEGSIKKLNSINIGTDQKDEEFSEFVDAESDETLAAAYHCDSEATDSYLGKNLEKPRSNLSKRLCSKLASLEIPDRRDMYHILKTDAAAKSCHSQVLDSPSEDGYETAEESFISEEEFMYPKANLFGEDDGEEEEEPIPKEQIMKRIDSHKGMKSYQLAKQLSSKWTTGAGPRISCMRDYPSELQFRVLEQANLSPRGMKSCHNTSTLSCKHTGTGRSPLAVQNEMLHQAVTL